MTGVIFRPRCRSRARGCCDPHTSRPHLVFCNDAGFGGQRSTPRILRSEKMGVPATGRHLVNALRKSAPGNESERASNQSSGVSRLPGWVCARRAASLQKADSVGPAAKVALRELTLAVWPFVFPLAPFFAKSESDQAWRRSLLCSEWPLASSQFRRARMLPWAKAILESAAP